MSRVKKGDILITEESRFGMQRLIYGPVVIIDDERKEIGIKVGEDIRSFPPGQLSTIYTFINNCRVGKPLRSQTLMGYIISLSESQKDDPFLREIADEFKKQGVKSVASQDVLEALLC